MSDRIAEIRQRLAAASPAAYDLMFESGDVLDYQLEDRFRDDYDFDRYAISEQMTQDWIFINHSREDIDHLLAEVDRLKALVRDVAAGDELVDWGTYCPSCRVILSNPTTDEFPHYPSCTWLRAQREVQA